MKIKKSLKIGICAFGPVGKELSEYICGLGIKHDIRFCCTLSTDKYSNKIKNIFEVNNIEVMTDVKVNSKKFASLMDNQKIDLIFLLWWPNIISQKIIEKAKIGFVNLHPSLLPYNRGMHPYYWSIVENTPAGVSIHFINKGIDQGSILFQREIIKDITTTGESLYSQAQKEIISLFKENYVNIINGEYDINVQDEKLSTFHLKKDLDAHSVIDLKKSYNALDLINIMRARSFKNGPSSYFYHNGKKYYINVEIRSEEK